MTVDSSGVQSKSQKEYREEALDDLQQNEEVGSVKDDDSAFVYHFFNAMGSVLENYVDGRLTDVYDSGTLHNAEGEALTRKAEEYGVFRNQPTKATGVVEFYREDPASTDFPIQSGTEVQTAENTPLRYETVEDVVLTEGSEAVKATVEALEGGVEYNLPSNRVTVMTSPPSGIDGVTNPLPIGNNTYSDTNGDSLIEGTNREEDEELRNRVFNSHTFGSSASAGGVENALLEIDDVEDAILITNSSPNKDKNLPPYTSEVLVEGGAIDVIGETLFDSMSITDLLRLEGGRNGTSRATYFTYSNIANKEISIPISAPTRRSIELDITFYYNNGRYVGDDEIKNNIVEYIGGWKTDGSYYRGLGIGDDVLMDQLRSNIVDSVDCKTGVYEFSKEGGVELRTDRGLFVDEALPVKDTEIATIDVEDITINSYARDY